MSVNYLDQLNPNPNSSPNNNRTWPSGASVLGPCPDQYKGELTYNPNSAFIFTPNFFSNIDYQVNATNLTAQCVNNINIANPIVIILESPHISEFCLFCHKALGPAMGVTGNNFIKYIDYAVQKSTKFKSFLKIDSTYPVIFVNAVQFQTSEGVSPINQQIRDSNWINEFNKNNDLLQRLQALNPYAIINLCTKGLNKDNTLQNQVETLINNNINSLSNNQVPFHTTGFHPASWQKLLKNHPSVQLIK